MTSLPDPNLNPGASALALITMLCHPENEPDVESLLTATLTQDLLDSGNVAAAFEHYIEVLAKLAAIGARLVQTVALGLEKDVEEVLADVALWTVARDSD